MQKVEKASGKTVPTIVDGYSSEFGYRISEAIERIGSLVQAGKVAGVTDEQLARWRDGYSKPNLYGIVRLAEAASLTVEWLATGEGRKNLSDAPVGNANTVSIPLLDVRASAGHGATGAYGEQLEMLEFPCDWLRKAGLKPTNASFLTVFGDSMEPTLTSGDLLLVDTSINKVRSGGIYILIRDDDVFVKRVERRMNGSIFITSDNSRYAPEEISESDAERICIAGRVVWYGRSI